VVRRLERTGRGRLREPAAEGETPTVFARTKLAMFLKTNAAELMAVRRSSVCDVMGLPSRSALCFAVEPRAGAESFARTKLGKLLILRRRPESPGGGQG